ncbi:hypothetical protein [Pseudoclavibacter helvolus]
MAQHRTALTTLIDEVLAVPDMAHSDEFRRMLQARYLAAEPADRKQLNNA